MLLILRICENDAADDNENPPDDDDKQLSNFTFLCVTIHSFLSHSVSFPLSINILMYPNQKGMSSKKQIEKE